MKTSVDAGPAGLLDEVGNAMAKGIDLDDEVELQPLLLTERDDAIENLLPVLVAGEVVVGDENTPDSPGEVVPKTAFDIVGRARPGLATLHVDNRTKAALKRAPAPGIDARASGQAALDDARGNTGQGSPRESGKIVERGVERFEPVMIGVAENLVEVTFRLPSEDGNPELLRLANLCRRFGEHGQRAADVKAADAHGNAGRPEGPGYINGARKLVGLDADQGNQAFAVAGLDFANDALRLDTGVDFVERRDPDVHMFAQNAPLGAIKGDSVKHPQGVRRDIGANPLDDVAVVIVMGRFDEIEVKRLALSARPFPRHHAASSPTFWGTLDRLSAQRGWRHPAENNKTDRRTVRH